MTRRIVVAITGATGAIYGVRLLQRLQAVGAESHLVVSRSGWLTLRQEMNLGREEVQRKATACYEIDDVGAAIASGSFRHDGMVVSPCSMRTLAAIAIGLNDNLVTRAADVTLKERRPLVLMARETPLTLAHLRNMTSVTEMGGRIMPPVPAFYAKPATIEDMVAQTVWRVLDQFGLADESAYQRWSGTQA
jgi:polyprenyl P-hydroxybenzoate/phenylacrylic acid decarboxylase-like protein